MASISGKPEPSDVSVDVHLEGSEAKITFILERCHQGIWEEEDKWEAKVKDEIDEHLADINQLQSTEDVRDVEMSSNIAQQISQYLERF